MGETLSFNVPILRPDPGNALTYINAMVRRKKRGVAIRSRSPRRHLGTMNGSERFERNFHGRKPSAPGVDRNERSFYK
jgi:hypothetical protein